MHAPGSQTASMDRWYRLQAPFFDLSRIPLLRGRRRLAAWVPPGARVLELGCGTGHNLAALQRASGPAGEVWGVDCCAALLRRARNRAQASPGLRLCQGEFPETPAAAERFDVVVCSYMLSMQRDVETCLRAIDARLRPGGRRVVLDFVDSPIPWLRRRMQGPCPGLGEAPFAPGDGAVLHDTEFRAFGGGWRYRLQVTQKQ